MDAEHIPAQFSLIVALGKALPGEGTLQFPEHGFRHRRAVKHRPVDSGHNRHILRPLHAALDFQGADAHLLQVVDILQQAVVLQAQGIFHLIAAVAVVHSAGLRAAAPVSAPPPDDAGEVALAGVAHAQSAMDKDLNLHGAHGADLGNLRAAQFSCQDHAGHAHIRRLQHAGDGMDAHLRGGMDCHLRSTPPAQPCQAEVLNNKGVHPGFGSRINHGNRRVHLPVKHQGVQRQMHLHAADMTHANNVGELFYLKITRPHSGVKTVCSQIDRVGTVLHGSTKRIHGTGR